MIPSQNLVAWGSVVAWADPMQIEQDLIISRALIEIFSDRTLREALRFRGGTALNKLHFPVPLRYSEDIDLVRTGAGPIGPILDQLREVLEPWLGRAQFDQSPVAPKFRFRIEAEQDDAPIRLKIEINTREIEAYDGRFELPLRVENPWFSGEAFVPTFSPEEMLATKLRALLQRDKGRDLFDLSHALTVFDGLDIGRVLEMFARYLSLADQVITRAEAQQRMFAKLAKPRFLLDMRPLLSADQAQALDEKATAQAFRQVFTELIDRLPGDPWAKADEMKDKFGISW
ncbi:MAG: nucleotidyl transferase AbiEii/AbiGii toxin family protein [Burkholderiaceae bacterium]|nr:nucleotidyl transferase AbiEii/AbiGii toxin family protein [Burkholderiaceae bacterium]MCD8515957.1 nucleotidyl transferase AbiEii/AbiGii toxin family protein [Burkholderiaceae bacterium]MCD8536993.1 nucleotidyl transferase AbiEii/AbiGii toxin family protein [Burkholderiaceae bacterium]MCD8564732.1 nucleotidyl transferase AbiEii/AbiGii toxin family protein [Burkholderiaceae bacterium]